jgi:hypothetical protein
LLCPHWTLTWSGIPTNFLVRAIKKTARQMLGDTLISGCTFSHLKLKFLMSQSVMTRSSSFIYRMRLTRRVGPGRSVQTICSFPHGCIFTHQKRYGVPYTQCGCPLPGNTIGQRLARLVSHAGSKHYPLSRLAPPADQPEILAASHPSDHNTVAVLGLPSNSTAKTQRESKAFRRREREASRVRKGEMTQEEFERIAEHTTPFLVPVPLTPAVMTPVTPLGQVMMGTDDWAFGSFAGCATVSRYLFLPFSFEVVTSTFNIQDSGAACITGSIDLNEGYVGSFDVSWPAATTT